MAVVAVVRGRLYALRVAGQRNLGLLDVSVAAALTIGGLVEVANLTYSGPAAVGVTSCMACTAPVAIRRRAPFAVTFIVTTALAAYQTTTNDPDGSFIVPAVALAYYYAGRTAAERSAWTGLAGLLGYALVADIVIEAANGPFSAGSALATWPVALAPAAAGIIAARHASLLRRLTAATASLRDEQRIRADRLLGEERNRVARELHDVVAHHVSVMVIQAGAARLVAADDPGTADAALQVVERSGRDALVDLRRIMGVIRRRDTPDADTRIGLAHVDQIVERARATGLAVAVAVSGRLDHLPAAVDFVAYRVVQEALTNVVKHAHPATASVVISVGTQVIDVTVTDSGVPSGPAAIPGAGHGLIGMRERVELYGGRLRSGHRPGGGFEVHASIPLRSEPLDHHDVSDLVDLDAHALSWPARTATRWLTAIKPKSDVLLATVWFAALEADAFTDHYRRGPLALNAAVVAVMAIAFVWRRNSPLLFLFIVGLAAMSLSSGLTSPHSTLVGFYCVIVPTFSLASWETRPRAVAGLALWLAGAVGTGVVQHQPVAGLTGGLISSSLLWTAGALWRSQRLLAERLADTHLLVAAEREDRERLAIVSERARIARELHAAVAQGVVAMIVQAAAARGAIGRDPDAVIEAASSIECTGRDALAQMRDILGVLRARRESLPLRPQPGVGQLHAMIQRLRDSGRTVELSIEGDPGPLPAGVDLTAYRIIEAALAEADPRPSREVTVALRFGDDRIEIEVTGTGVRLPSRLRLTVRERAAMCDGAMLPPPATDNGPRLVVRLPFAIAEPMPA